MKEFKTQKEIAERIADDCSCAGVSCTNNGPNADIPCPLCMGGRCVVRVSVRDSAITYLASLDDNEAECECVTKTKIKREFTKNVTYELNGETYSPEDERAKIADLVTGRNLINAQLKEKRATLKAFESSGVA